MTALALKPEVGYVIKNFGVAEMLSVACPRDEIITEQMD
jgi:hypothetical protein